VRCNTHARRRSIDALVGGPEGGGAMSRTVRRRTIKEGRSLGDYVSESLVYLVVIAGLVIAVRWYFVTYLRSPSPVLSQYLAAIKAGDVDTQYRLLSTATKSRWFPTQSIYADRFKAAQGLAGRISDFTITKLTEDPGGQKAVADVSLAIRDARQELYQASAKSYKDVYVLRKEPDGWRVALEESWDKMESSRAAANTR
jgi:hypothetical protein